MNACLRTSQCWTTDYYNTHWHNSFLEKIFTNCTCAWFTSVNVSWSTKHKPRRIEYARDRIPQVCFVSNIFYSQFNRKEGNALQKSSLPKRCRTRHYDTHVEREHLCEDLTGSQRHAPPCVTRERPLHKGKTELWLCHCSRS